MNYKIKNVLLGNHLYIKGRIGWKGLKKEEYLTKGGYKIINATAIEENNINWDNCGFVTKERYDESPEIMLKINDILISKDGTIGKVGMVKNLNFPSTIASGIFVVRNNTDYIDTTYLYYFFKSPYFKWFIKTRTEGSVVPHLYQRDFSNLKFRLFELNIQKKISEILLKIDNKIGLNNKLNQNLVSIAQSLYLEEFQNLDNYSDEELVESEIGLIPKGWNVQYLESISKVAIGKTPPRKEQQWFSTDKNDVKWVSIKDLGNNGLYIFDTSECLTKEAVDKFNVKLIPKDTVLLSFKLTVGRLAITTEEMVTNEAIAHCVINEDNDITKEYLYFYLKNFNFESLGSTSSIAKAINSKIVKKMPILVPDSDKLQKFSKQVKVIFDMIKNNQLENSKLENMRDILLPKLMNGEIDASKIEI